MQALFKTIHLDYKICLLVFSMFFAVYDSLSGAILEVGPGKPYASPAQAAPDAMPGDTILIFPAIYTGSNFISNLHGTEGAYIYFVGVDAETVIFQGGSQGMHFSQVSYIHISSLSFTGHTGNGMNIDDAGTFETPTHHVIIENCHFYDMGATGNNDFLKMSGVDFFEVYDCTFENGAAGGSGIDMVGCHHGDIRTCNFNGMGSNCIQAKGGTQFITIAQNWFQNGGHRSLNLGGSTGLDFFRPQDAPFEAADLDVYANVFIGSTAPIAYVGCVRVHVVNNTIINPGTWIIRILQETVDTSRFLPCGDNSFVNNLVYYNNNVSTHVNMGPDTDPESFIFSNNLWYRHTAPANSAPVLPVPETNAIIGEDPLLMDPANENFNISSNSPAIDSGTPTDFNVDHEGSAVPQGSGTDIGAYEFPVILPVSFVSFQVRVTSDNQVELIWETEEEINNEWFVVERSVDGMNWVSVDSVQATDSNLSNTYKVIDNQPLNGLIYYRIKQIDRDLRFSYSEIKSIHLESKENSNIHVYPNPFQSNITIRGELNAEKVIEIVDSRGQIILRITPDRTEKEEDILVTLDHLSPGLYFIKSGHSLKKVIKTD